MTQKMMMLRKVHNGIVNEFVGMKNVTILGEKEVIEAEVMKRRGGIVEVGVEVGIEALKDVEVHHGKHF